MLTNYELKFYHKPAMRNSGTSGFGLEGLVAKCVWQANSENLLKTFHPWLWRLDWDFSGLAQGLYLQCTVLWDSEISFYWKTKASSLQLWPEAEEHVRLPVSLSPSSQVLDEFRVIWKALPPLGVHSEVWGITVKLCWNISCLHGG